VRRVVLAFGGAYEKMARQAEGAIAMSWLQKVYDAYRSVGLKSEANQILLLSKQKGQEATRQMRAVETKFEIPKEEFDAELARFTEGELADVLVRLAVHFTPRETHVRDRMAWAREHTPFLALAGQMVIGNDQIVARVGAGDSDDEGRLIRDTCQHMDFDTFFLRVTLDATRSKFDCTADDIMGFLACGVLFDPGRHPLLREGVASYLEGDHVKAVHIIVPQIEHALRVLLARLGQPTNKPMRSGKGVMQEKTLTDILEYEPAIRVWAEKNSLQDWLVYLRCLLIDPRGHNLRNRLAHGLMGPDEFGRQVSDRALHVLLLLSLVGRPPCSETSQSSGNAEGK
jgi:hypothetical protein